MNQPTVGAVMLTKDRPELAHRAVQSFQRQTYQNRVLLIWDNGGARRSALHRDHEGADHRIVRVKTSPGSIDVLRNAANTCWSYPSIIVHWDDDDWSYPNRITEQVALLQASGADAVGYREMLFWRERGDGEAWLYRHPKPDYILGTSLCYWRRVWEQKPFRMEPGTGGTGEDHFFVSGLKVQSISAVPSVGSEDEQPSMIARIHSANTMPYDIEGLIARGSREWKRVPEWDQRVGEIMK